LARIDSVLGKVLCGTSDASVAFDELRGLLRRLGFDERVRGDHHIFVKEGVTEILNLQPRGAQAKPYQVKQVRNIILKYGMGGRPDAL